MIVSPRLDFQKCPEWWWRQELLTHDHSRKRAFFFTQDEKDCVVCSRVKYATSDDDVQQMLTLHSWLFCWLSPPSPREIRSAWRDWSMHFFAEKSTSLRKRSLFHCVIFAFCVKTLILMTTFLPSLQTTNTPHTHAHWNPLYLRSLPRAAHYDALSKFPRLFPSLNHFIQSLFWKVSLFYKEKQKKNKRVDTFSDTKLPPWYQTN